MASVFNNCGHFSYRRDDAGVRAKMVWPSARIPPHDFHKFLMTAGEPIEIGSL